MFGRFPPSCCPYSVKSSFLSTVSGSKYSLLITTKLLYSSKNIAVCVAIAILFNTSATFASGSTNKYGITGSFFPSIFLKI